MSLCVIFIILACVYVSHSWNLNTPGRFPGIQEQQLRLLALKRPQCFSLARKIRPLKINVPLIYNKRTGQASPVPRFLLSVDDKVVARIENDGWEVRRNIISIPQSTYERVPVCCPWDQNCDQGRRTPVKSFDASGLCANGGQLIYRDGVQRCDCSPGFQGTWCQIPVSTSENQSTTTFPSGPLIQLMPPAIPNSMLKETELQRSKAMQIPLPPMLSPGDHLLAAVTRPWVRAAMLQQQNMRAKMAQAEEVYKHAQGNFYNQMPPNGMNEVRGNENTWGSNPYSAIDSNGSNPFTSGQEIDHNPYSSLSYQGQLPPNLMRAFSVVHQNLKDAQAVNPYSHLPQEASNPHLLPLIQRVNVEQNDLNPYNRQPQDDLNLYRRRPQDVPQARTPWDLDPFGQQQNPSYMNYPGMPMGPNRNQQAMTVALYQQMMSQQRGRLPERKKSLNHPLLGATGLQNPLESLPVSRDSQLQPLVTDKSIGLNNQSEQEIGTNVSNSNQTDGQQSPVKAQSETPQVMSKELQQQPSTEELSRIEQCQAIIMPKLSSCLQGYDLTMEQFMNPEYMARARAVCDASQSVGQCLMQHDKVCGGGDAILTARRVINSVLRMMGVVCQQIAARGETSNMPVQGPQDSPEVSLRGVPSQVTETIPQNQPASFNSPLTPLNEEQVPPLSDNRADELKQTSTPKYSHMTSAHNEGVPESPIKKERMGHDSVHPVSQELKVFGYPLWLIITLGLALFVAFFLFFVVLCLCCRHRYKQKSGKAKEIEKIPVSLDSKICTIDIPPPSYNTAVVLQNDDGLSLPPLDLSNGSGNARLESIKEKPTNDVDSDDENDAMEEPEKGK